MAQGFGKTKVKKSPKPSKVRKRQSNLQDSLKKLFDSAIKHHQNNKHSSAIKVCQNILEQAPDFIDALHLLGNLYYQQNQIDLATDAYQQVILKQPDRVDVLNNLSIIYLQQGKTDLALADLHQIIQINPKYAEGHSNLGQIYQDSGQPEQAKIHLHEAIALKPNFATAHYNLGNVYKSLDESSLAINCYQQAIQYNPSYVDAYFNLGNLYKELNDFDSAKESYQQAIKYNPSRSEAHFNLGNLYKELNDFDSAKESYQQAIKLNPQEYSYYYNLGHGYLEQNCLTEAIACYKKVIALESNCADAYNNLAKAYKDQGDLTKAIPNYQKALKIAPKNKLYYQNLLFALNYTQKFSAKEVYQEHLNWGKQNKQDIIQLYKNSYNPDRKLKIGFVSGDFSNHSISYFFEPLLANCDHESFEIFCYYNNDIVDQVTTRFKQLSDAWLNVNSLKDPELIEKIQQDRIDILVDLSGHSRGNRLSVFAAKPAPIQVTYLGYPNTTGLTTIDYRLTDSYADIPKTSPQLYTEKLIYLPHNFLCYSPPANFPAVSKLPAINNKFITFGSFNNIAKLSPETIKYWASILQRIPDSRLVIKYKALADSGTCDRIYNLFAERGINSNRLQLLGWIAEKNSHLAAYNTIDIALDTFPYHGTTTTCEALYMGVPVITLAGEVHASRVGVSILSSVGVTELIANNPEEYINTAVTLAQDLPRLKKLRCSLRNKMQQSYLMDGKQITQDMEFAYRQMWQQWCQQKKEKTPEVTIQQAVQYLEQKKPLPAQEILQKIIQQQPKNVTAWQLLGSAYYQQQKFTQAIANYQKALTIEPNNALVLGNLGVTYIAYGDLETALNYWQQALKLQPNRNRVLQNILFCLHYSSKYSPEYIYQQHLNWGKRHQTLAPQASFIYKNNPNPQRKLRIGYVSGDLKHHPVAYFLTPLLANCDRQKFEIFCYANNTKKDEFSQKIEQLTDGWRDISHLDDLQAIHLIKQDKIDILVDLSGHNGDNRLLIFARKPAPLQVTYLGYADTTGLDTVDYRFTDNDCDPQGKTEHLHTEELLRLPNSFLCYQPHTTTSSVSSPPVIKNGYITFGSFNNLAKVSAEVISYWGQILQQVPQSKILIKYRALNNPEVCDRLYQLFAQQGITQDRIILKGWLKNSEDHLATYGEIDIALDTFPYHGTTTTCEALYMGVPVITLAGEVHISRVGVSLLSNVGLSELITKTPAEYINRAISLANNVQRLKQLRANLRSQMQASPLMNSKQITADIEAAYRQMWLNFCSSQTVEDVNKQSQYHQDIKKAFNLYQQGNLKKSREFLELILDNFTHDPHSNTQYLKEKYDCWQLLGNIYHQQKKLDLAIDAYKKLIELKPQASLMSNLGVLYIQQNQIDKAISTLKKAIALKPDYLDAYNNLGELYREQKQYTQAEKIFQQIIKLKPDHFPSHYHLGLVYRELKNYPGAVTALKKAIAYQPKHDKAYVNLCFVLQQQGKTKEAEAHYHQAIKLVPDSEIIYFNLGNFYKDLGKLTPALNAYLKAVQIKPDADHVYNNLGCLYRDLGRVKESLAAFRQAIAINPDLTSAWQNLLYYLQYSDQYSPTEIAQEHLRWGKTFTEKYAVRGKYSNKIKPNKNLRIGYLSGDLRTHSVAYFLEPILQHHNSQEFTIHCYSNNPLDDAATDRFKQLVATWHDIQELDDEAVVDLIQADEIDILVDLAGHTGGNRIMVMAKQPAPIQVVYLGYPNTTGLDTIKYRITDAHSDPIDTTENLHSEELIHLPETFLCYQPPKDTPEVNSLPAEQNGYLTFGSFNHIAKISETTINCWLKILQAVPNSRLILKSKSLQDQANRDRVYKIFTTARISCDRLEFRGWTASIQDHFALYHEIDLALDTYPYNGTTTTCEALWMGVPVVTLAGASHVSRVGVSLLTSVGLTELIAENPADYIRKAIELANDPARLSQLRQNNRIRISSSPLMAGKQFTQNFELAYRQIWQEWCRIESCAKNLI